MFAPKIAKAQRKIAANPTSGLVPKSPALGAKPNAATIGVPDIVQEALRSPGKALEPSTRSFMELRFGHDFSTVRVHTDDQAAESARAVGATAYSVGGDIVFAAGQYAPALPEGRELLAHEFTHVVQQEGAPTRPGHLSIKRSDDSAEREAHAAAAAIANGNCFRPQTRSELALACQGGHRRPPPAGWQLCSVMFRQNLCIQAQPTW